MVNVIWDQVDGWIGWAWLFGALLDGDDIGKLLYLRLASTLYLARTVGNTP